MQALSFAVHIPLVCFGIAFPALVLFVEWLYLRTGDPLYRDAGPALVEGDGRAVRRRRRDRHDPQLRAGPAVAELHGDVRRRLRARLRDRGLLVLPRGDLHRDLRLRLGPAVAARALPLRHPDRDRRLHRLADGDRGQRLDEPPGAASGSWTARRSTSHPCDGAVRQHLLLARARAHVPRRLHRRRLPRRGRLRVGRAARALGPLRADRARDPARRSPRSPRRCRCSSATGRRARWRERAAGQARRASKGSARRPKGAPDAHPRLVRATARSSTGSRSRRLLSLLAYHDPNATVQGLDAVPPDDRPPVNVVRFAFQTMVGIGTLLAALGVAVLVRALAAPAAAASRAGSTARSWLAGPALGRRADRGWVTTEVGRQPWVVYGVMRTVARRSPAPAASRSATRRSRSSTRRSRVAVAWILRRLARAPLDVAATRRRRRSRLMRASLDELPLLFVARRAGALRRARRGRLRRRLLAAARRPRRSAPRAIRDHAHHAMGAGLGGQPRLADLRARSSCWTAYPTAFGSIASTLAIPLFIAAVGIILRGTAYALRSGARRRASCARSTPSSRVSSILTPFALGAAIGGIASGRVPVGNAAGRPRLELAQPDLAC